MTPRANELRHLAPAVVARLGSLELRARTIVEGFLLGLHRSPGQGFSTEFSEYRQYLPGDDTALVDWKLYARSDRHYVRKFEAETNLDCHLLLDVSGSMGYGSAGVTKQEHGSHLAAAIAYLMSRQHDAVGLLAFDERIVRHLPPSARPGHLRRVLLALDALPAGRGSDVSKPLSRLAAALSRRGLVVLISDLLDEPDRVVRGLRQLRFRGADVVVFQLLDHAELTFPFERPARFRDLETAAEVAAPPLLVREHYLKALRGLIARYRRELRLAGIDHCLVDTSRPLDLALHAYLSARSRRH